MTYKIPVCHFARLEWKGWGYQLELSNCERPFSQVHSQLSDLERLGRVTGISHQVNNTPEFRWPNLAWKQTPKNRQSHWKSSKNIYDYPMTGGIHTARIMRLQPESISLTARHLPSPPPSGQPSARQKLPPTSGVYRSFVSRPRKENKKNVLQSTAIYCVYPEFS